MQFGICRLSLVPVRTEPSDRSEMCTQLLFGEIYRVQEQSTDGKWLSVQTLYDQYNGWISAIQHLQISDGYLEAYEKETHPCTTSLLASVQTSKNTYHLLPGSTLPFLVKIKLR